MRKAVFLDRDGVLNRAFVHNGKPKPPLLLSQVEILPGVEDAISILKKMNYILIVITNQPDIARGVISKSESDEINSYLKSILSLDEIYTCEHDDIDNCECRKPKPGAIHRAAYLHNINLSKSYMIGDRWRDIEAGFRSGCKTIFIDYGYKEKQPSNYEFKVFSLYDASMKIKQLESKYAF